MKTIVVLIFVTILETIAAAPVKVDAPYTKKMFLDALNRGGFVLVTVRYPANGTQRRICTMSTFLEGAVHIEHRLDYDTAGNKRADQIAINHWDRVISFSRPKAFENIKPRYTSQQLSEIRKKLANVADSELRKSLKRSSSELDTLYASAHLASYKDAVAHVLLERGIAVGLDDRTSLLAPLPPD